MLERRTLTSQGDVDSNQRQAVLAWLREPETILLVQQVLERLQRSGYYMEQVKGLARSLVEELQHEVKRDAAT